MASQRHFSWLQRLLWLPPILLGILVLVLAPKMKAAPPTSDTKSKAKPVRVMQLVPRNITPTAIGYGRVTPETDWQAQAELSGTVVWISDTLKNGALIRKGEPLLKLDSASYQLAVTQLEAELNVTQIKDNTIQSSIKIAEQDVALQKAEDKRLERLAKTGHVSASEREASNHQLLNSEQQLQTLKNNLAINRAEQNVLNSRLSMARLDLEHTQLHAPFDLRITSVDVDQAQYINRGQPLFQADGIEAVEISAQFPIGKLRPLRQQESGNPHQTNGGSTSLSAMVELSTTARSISWPAEVVRSVGSIDPQTQSQGIVVKVATPYQQAVPGQRPPLIRNTFVKVILQAPALHKQILLPVTAIHRDQVYVVNQDNELEIRPIKVDFIQQQVAVIRSGLKAGDRVVLSQLSPAVAGMKLKAKPDKQTVQWLEHTTGFKASKTGSKGGKA